MAKEDKFWHIPIQAVWKSVCKECFCTVAWGDSQEELPYKERNHKCDESR